MLRQTLSAAFNVFSSALILPKYAQQFSLGVPEFPATEFMARCWLHPFFQLPLQQMPVTVRRIFRTMAKQGNRHPFAQGFQESERKFLPMVFDRHIPSVDRSALF